MGKVLENETISHGTAVVCASKPAHALEKCCTINGEDENFTEKDSYKHVIFK